MEENLVTLTIDGQKVTVPEGTTILKKKSKNFFPTCNKTTFPKVN